MATRRVFTVLCWYYLDYLGIVMDGYLIVGYFHESGRMEWGPMPQFNHADPQPRLDLSDVHCTSLLVSGDNRLPGHFCLD